MTTIDKNIEAVMVSVATDLASKNPKLWESIIKNHYFTTYVEGDTQYGDKIIRQGYVIIDTTRDIQIDDWDTFHKYSLYLFDKFDAVKKWYKC